MSHGHGACRHARALHNETSTVGNVNRRSLPGAIFSASEPPWQFPVDGLTLNHVSSLIISGMLSTRSRLDRGCDVMTPLPQYPGFSNISNSKSSKLLFHQLSVPFTCVYQPYNKGWVDHLLPRLYEVLI